jgi:hypothetical protein
MGIKIFNKLPTEIKVLSHDTKEFKKRLKVFLHSNSFYIIQEYFNYQNK